MKKRKQESRNEMKNEISPLYRTTIKRNNVTVWTIASESGHTYSTTVFAGKVTSCKREDGTKCPGYFHYGTCHHAALVLEREQERQPVEVVLPPLHNNREFSLMR
jgi:hypothetical protein